MTSPSAPQEAQKNVPAFTVLILAAGKGTRMPSPRPKTVQTLLGESMAGLVWTTAATLPEADRVLTLVGWGAEQVRSEVERAAARLARRGKRVEALCVEQREQLGTGHALRTALPALEGGADRVMALNGDTPLISAGMLRRFAAEADGADVAFVSLRLDEPGAYGRVVRDADGAVRAIVEARDYEPAVHGENPREINAGIYLITLDAARRLLPRLSNGNRSGEYYITDLVGLAVAEGMDVRAVVGDGGRDELLGINTPAELAAAEEGLRRRRTAQLLAAGVILHAPESVRVGPFAVVEPGAELTGPCEIYGDSVVARGACVESHCVLRDARVAEGAVLRPFCHVEDAEVGPRCQVGPYARLRPGAVLEEDAHMGNFVEMKKARLGRGAKANHLTYLGDADIGAGANIGAGTITCNYDGVHKHRTVIGAGAFIGSNTALVAPVSVGEGALVGAGSVITRDVPDGELGVGRARQVNIGRKA